MCIEEEMTEKNQKRGVNMNILLPCSTAFPTTVFTLTRSLYNVCYLQHHSNNLQSHIHTHGNVPLSSKFILTCYYYMWQWWNSIFRIKMSKVFTLSI